MSDVLFEQLSTILENKEKCITLVRHRISGICYIRKCYKNEVDEQVYEQLKANPHEHLAQIMDVYKTSEGCCVIEEYINGVTLEYKISEHNLTREEVLSIMTQLCLALEHIHQLTPPIIHRDIKPANIMIDNGIVKLIDFDIARHFTNTKSKDTQVIGSVGYAAPEQYGFRESDQRSDLYALGVLYQELLGDMICEQDQMRINRCTQMDPNQRYQTAKELRFALCDTPDHMTKWRRLIKELPGFCHESIPKKLCIFVYDFFCIALSVGVEFKVDDPTITQILQRIAIFAIFFCVPFISQNKFHLAQITPLFHSNVWFLRFLNGVLAWLFWSLLLLMVCVMINSTILELL